MQNGTIDLEAGCRPAEVKAAWIAALDRHLGWDDRPRSYRLLNAVLQALHESLADKAIGRCGRAAVDEHDELDTHLLLQRVATGFRPDRLEHPEGAVLAVLDVLDPDLDKPGLPQIRGQLLQSVGASRFNPATVKWSASWPNPS